MKSIRNSKTLLQSSKPKFSLPRMILLYFISCLLLFLNCLTIACGIFDTKASRELLKKPGFFLEDDDEEEGDDEDEDDDIRSKANKGVKDIK